MKNLLFILAILISNGSYSIEVITFVSDPYPPYVQENEATGIISGSAIDKIKQIFSYIPKVKVEFRIRPWVRAMIEVEEGSADAVLQISFKQERTRKFQFTDPYISGRLNLYYNRFKYPKGINWKVLPDLANYSIGTVRGYYYSDEWSNAEKSGVVNSSQLTNAESLIQFIILDRVDIILLNKEVAELKLAELDLQHKIIPLTKPLKTYSWHMAFSHRTQAKRLIPKINEIIHTLKLQGEL